MFLNRIQNRLVLTFVFFVVSVVLAGAWTLHWTVRQSLEQELGRKLEAVANAASVLIADEGQALFSGADSPLLSRYLRGQLNALQSRTQVNRITVFDWEHRILLDTADSSNTGMQDYQLQFYEAELQKLRHHQSSHSVLFAGVEGTPAMSGYAPFFIGQTVSGGVAVDGSATFLREMNRLTQRLVWLSIFILMLALMSALILARTLTHPMIQLTRASTVIAAGNYQQPIPDLGKSEMGELGRTMEEMRKSVLQREEELKGMLAGVAHEIRNPLGGMELFCDLLLDEVKRIPQARDHVSRIQKEIQQLKHIVTSFLDFARPQQPQKDKIILVDLLNEVISLNQDKISSQTIQPRVQCSADLCVLADWQHLRRILINLLQNAVQAMAKGGRLEIEAAKTGPQIQITIRDTGSGIPEEVRADIFSPFFTTRHQGTGLGLSIVKQLAEANGGRVELMASDSSGTTFALYFQNSQAQEKLT